MATSFDTTSAGVIGTEDDDTIEMQLSESALQGLQDAADAAMAESEHLPTTAERMPAAANDPEARPAKVVRARLTIAFSVVAVAALLLTGVDYLAKSRGSGAGAPVVVGGSAAVPKARAGNVATAATTAAAPTAAALNSATAPAAASAAAPVAAAAPTTAARTDASAMSAAATASAIAPVAATPTDASTVVAPPPVEDPALVHVKNPFDRTEVFEFPAGTSDTDARDAVAQVLAQRALERQVQLRKVPHRNSRTADRNTPVTITPLTVTKLAPQS